MRPAVHMLTMATTAIVVAACVDALTGWMELGASLGSTALAALLAALLGGLAALLGRGSPRAAVATAAWGAWVALALVRVRFGFVSLLRIDGGMGPPTALALVVFPIVGLSSTIVARQLGKSTAASVRT